MFVFMCVGGRFVPGNVILVIAISILVRSKSVLLYRSLVQDWRGIYFHLYLGVITLGDKNILLL